MSDSVDNLCRACLSTKDSFTYFLFEHVTAETYSFCTSIEPKEDEAISRALCDGCYNLLQKYSEFKRTCIESQNTLLGYKNIKTEDIKPVPKEVESSKNSTTNDLFLEIKSEVSIKEEKLEEQFSDGIYPISFNKGTLNLAMRPKIWPKEGLPEFPGTDIISHTTNFNRDVFNLNSLFNKKKRHIIQRGALSEDSMTLETLASQKKKESLESENGIIIDLKEPVLYSCEMCDKKFKYIKRLQTHRLGHFNNDEETTPQCLKCSKSFMTMGSLRRHEESVHAGVRLTSVACTHCGRVCASKYSLREHQKRHANKRAHSVCHVCGKKVSSAILLRAHLETHKADRERRYTCEHCGKKFFTNIMLLTHIKRQHSGLRYICEMCNYPFTNKHNLAKHILIHEGKKLYKCDICSKSYRTNGSLVEHKRIHSGERPFICSFCPKSFLSKRRLLDHHKTHTGDKPHKCSVCEQRFAQRGTLKRHMKVHDPMKGSIKME